MTALYVLAAEFRAMAEKLADLDLPPEVVADTLDAEAGDLDAKLTACAMVAQNLAVVADAKKEAAGKLAMQAMGLQTRADSIRATIKRTMLACGRSKIACDPMLTLAIKGKAASVLIFDETQIPAEFMAPPPSAPPPKPSKTLIGAALKAGRDVPGARLGNDVTRLEIG